MLTSSNLEWCPWFSILISLDKLSSIQICGMDSDLIALFLEYRNQFFLLCQKNFSKLNIERKAKKKNTILFSSHSKYPALLFVLPFNLRILFFVHIFCFVMSKMARRNAHKIIYDIIFNTHTHTHTSTF